MIRAALLGALSLAASGVPVAPAQQRQRLELAHLAKAISLSTPQFGPDGRSIVLVVSRPRFLENREVASLVLVHVRSGTQTVLLRDRPGLAMPAWSPSGDRIAFLAKPDTARESKLQLFVLTLAGRTVRRLAAPKRGVQHFAWRPDGSAVAYVTEDDPPRREGEARHETAFEVGENDMYLAAAPLPAHIWLVPAAGGKPRRLTEGPWSLPVTLPPGPPSSRLSWSPDGRTLAFARRVRPHSGVADSVSIQLLDPATGQIRPLTGDATFESMPTYSPDGRLIAYWRVRDGDLANVQEVHAAPAEGGAGRSLTRGIDRNLFLTRWLPDGSGILVGGNDGTGTGLWIQPLNGPARRLDLGELVLSGTFGLDPVIARDGAIAFTATTPGRPVELYYMASAAATPRRLTDFNAQLAALDLGWVETVRWTGPEGWEEDGVLVLPPGFDSTRRYPLVLLIHGGPRSSSKTGFSLQAQLMAARGWLVFQPNYRGSDNLGNAYQRAIWDDWGRGPGRDVMSGVAELKQRSYVDANRMAVTGWSYGGYMATWLAANYADQWQVAVAGAPLTDFEDMYNLGDANVLYRYRRGGSPWVGDRSRYYREQSPITYATRIRAPTLIMSCTQDYRVPITQSYNLFHALRDNGVETRFFAYPSRSHYPLDPVNARDVTRRWIEWVDQHLPPKQVSVR